ncbi:hypothetical protein NDU88_002970 [Pleurodeles waltl]|uniref:Basic proline-rich protein-like n=1 Tax=Pleurodeles waltl TaxID=8319 RepID=A0AAV7W627_PLEWA|nr:hypothetical protein NDU88_002970 [Pleurodeles waltl]
MVTGTFPYDHICWPFQLAHPTPSGAIGPRAPPPIKQPRGLLPGRTVTPVSRCSDSLSRPRAVPNPFRGATPVSKNSTTGRVYSWAIGPQQATPPQRGDSSGVPRCPRADRPRAASVRSPARGHNPDRGPAPVFSWGRPPPGGLPRRTPTGRNHSRAPSGTSTAAGGLVRGPPPPRSVCPHAVSDRGPNRQLRRSGGTPLASPAVLGPTALEPPRSAAPPGATTSIAGRLPYSPGAARLQEHCLAAPRLGATTLGLSGPFRHFRSHRGGARPGSPAAPLRLPSHRVGSRPDARPRPRPRAQASGSRAHQRADFAPRHSPGSPRGPTLARPLPPAQPLRSDLDRPGEGALSNVFSPAPPEREIQACAISRSLATPPNAHQD